MPNMYLNGGPLLLYLLRRNTQVTEDIGIFGSWKLSILNFQRRDFAYQSYGMFLHPHRNQFSSSGTQTPLILPPAQDLIEILLNPYRPK